MIPLKNITRTVVLNNKPIICFLRWGNCIVKSVGFLYHSDDRFALTRMDMLVGPMRLAGLEVFRFTPGGLINDMRVIHGDRFVGNDWQSCVAESPLTLIDLTSPNCPRHSDETTFLARVRHSLRVDGDRYELLQAISSDRQLAPYVVPTRRLDAFDDLVAAVKEWGAVMVKDLGDDDMLPVRVESVLSGWRVCDANGDFDYSHDEFIKYIAQRCNDGAYLQRYVPCHAADGKHYAFLITVQQRRDLAWLIPTLHCITGLGSIIASLRAGGEYIGPPFTNTKVFSILDGENKPLAAKLSQRLQVFSILVARRLECWLGGPPGALAFKVLLDAAHEPVLIDVIARPAAPCRAARNLEFHKYMAEFAHGLGHCAPVLDEVGPARRSVSRTRPMNGVSVRGYLPEAHALELASTPPDWLDLGLGNGGRKLLLELARRPMMANVSLEPYLSFRMGLAISDAPLLSDGLPRLVAVEDYAGRGLLTWSEARHMRSVRLPFLKAQFAQARQVLAGRSLDMLWIEDFDIGVRALDKNERASAMAELAAWLDSLCLQGWADRWGLMLFNGLATEVADWVGTMVSHAGCYGRFNSVAVRIRSLGKALCAALARDGIELIELAESGGKYVAPAIPHQFSGLLIPWRPSDFRVTQTNSGIPDGV